MLHASMLKSGVLWCTGGCSAHLLGTSFAGSAGCRCQYNRQGESLHVLQNVRGCIAVGGKLCAVVLQAGCRLDACIERSRQRQAPCVNTMSRSAASQEVCRAGCRHKYLHVLQSSGICINLSLVELAAWH